MWNDKKSAIYYRSCENYENEAVYSAVRELLNCIDTDHLIKDKKIVIKPNLLLKATPDKAITTHPLAVEAIAKICFDTGAASVCIAESPGGPYTEASLKSVYSASGMKDAAERSGAELNYSSAYTEVFDNTNELLKVFNMIDPILEADTVINVSRLKSHALTTMSGAVKNLFGVIPGIQKFETHARFPDHTDFANAMIDICKTVHEKKNVINITEAVIGIEGNGPSTSGIPRKIGYIAMSENPFNLDLFNSHMIGFDGKVEMIELSRKRGYTYCDFSELNIIGNGYESKIIKDFKLPDSNALSIFKHIPSFLSPRPKVNKKLCKGCGECEKSCPAHTIKIKDKKADIDASKCIKCFCCQELCPFHAIDINENFVYKLVRKIEKKI